jgi:plastocyanin
VDDSGSQQVGGRQRARWTRLAVLGLLMEAAAPALFLIAVLIWKLDLGEAGFFVIVLVIPLVGALLVWRFGWWARVVGLITALLPALAMFWTAFGFALPASFFEFVPAFLVIPGALIAVVSLVASLIAGRRGHMTAAATGGERTAIRLVLSLIALGALVSGVLTVLGRSSVPEAAAAVQTIHMKDFRFEPKAFSVSAGASVVLRNDDPFFHTFTVDELGLNHSFTPGDEQVIKLPDKAGTYTFYCRPHTQNPDKPGEEDMAGVLTVG